MRGIVAMDLNRVIGNGSKIPWTLKEDMKFFRKMTSDPETGGYLLMGRKTFDDVGKLPNRLIYVLTNDAEKLALPADPNFQYIKEEDFNTICQPDTKVWVCGGAKVYDAFLSRCDEVYVTIVLDEYEGDVYLEPFEDYFPNQEKIYEGKTHWIIKYSK
jgi:dihydrofolate reductase